MKNNIKLIIGIALPLLVVIFVIGAIMLPRLFFNPKHDFLYTVAAYCTSYDCRYYGDGYNTWYPYKVVDGKIAKETVLPKPTRIVPQTPDQKVPEVQVTYPKIYRYSVATEGFSEISLEEAQKLSITDGGSAPDGSVVVNDRYGRGLIGEILGGGGSYGLYIKNKSASKKIIVENAVRSDYYYNSNFHLIGWVK